jgi:hypothetical protein
MATDPTSITSSSTLLEELIARTRLSWLQVTITVELVLILFLVGAAYLNGVLARPFDVNFWQVHLLWPAEVAYVLSVWPLSSGLRDGAIRAFRPLVPLDDSSFHRLLAEASLFNRRREWTALGMLLIVGVSLGQVSMEGSGWLMALSELLAPVLAGGLLGLVINSSMSDSKLFTELSHYPLNVSVFDLASLEPIARWSMGTTLMFIGGITLGNIFLPRAVLLDARALVLNLIINIPIALTAILVFFLNMKSVHGDMVEAKQRELQMVRENLLALSQDLQERTATGEIQDTRALLGSVKAWTDHEEWVRALPEWPYTTAIKRNLVLSLFLPGVVGIIREALFGTLRDWLSF